MDPKNPLADYSVGQPLRGQVVFRAAFGVFIEVGRVQGFPIDALVMFERGPVPGPAGGLNVGDEVKVIVTEFRHVTKSLRAKLAEHQDEDQAGDCGED
jgi:ribosomal protein S1